MANDHSNNQATSGFLAFDPDAMHSVSESLDSLACLAERTLSDLAMLGHCISEKLSRSESENLGLKIANGELLSELCCCRESEELAYEKLKLLREELRSNHLVRMVDSESAISKSNSCPLTARSWSTVNSNEQLDKRISALEQKQLEAECQLLSKKSVFTDNIERDSHSSMDNTASFQAGREELKSTLDVSQYYNTSNGELASNDKMESRLNASLIDMEVLWRRAMSLEQEAAALSRMLSKRDHEVAALGQQLAATNRVLAQREYQIARLEASLDEEHKRSERNREVAAKVIQASESQFSEADPILPHSSSLQPPPLLSPRPRPRARSACTLRFTIHSD
jgi:hypothetical protein